MTLNEHEAARWLTKEHLDEVGWLPADVDVVNQLKKNELEGSGISRIGGIVK